MFLFGRKNKHADLNKVSCFRIYLLIPVTHSEGWINNIPTLCGVKRDLYTREKKIFLMNEFEKLLCLFLVFQFEMFEAALWNYALMRIAFTLYYGSSSHLIKDEYRVYIVWRVWFGHLYEALQCSCAPYHFLILREGLTSDNREFKITLIYRIKPSD